ncbi:MAG: glycoside hydrolase family 2 protein [Planctomycetota bacterium]
MKKSARQHSQEFISYLTMSLLAVIAASPTVAEWRPGKVPLVTKWADEIAPDTVHPEYPRPQMVRKDWLNLNGLWEYAILPKDQDRPATYDGEILVPFAAESALSGVTKRVGHDKRLWYRRSFSIPQGWSKNRILLHFGAVDWHAVVWVNGQKAGEHKGGYDAFTFDITDAAKGPGEHELVVAVWDPTDTGNQPRGKQVTEPRGIWYTPVTGIWQTVWLEPARWLSIRSLKLTCDIDRSVVFVEADTTNTNPEFSFSAVAKDGDKTVCSAAGPIGTVLELKIPDAKLWSPQSPFLYDLEVSLDIRGKVMDAVNSYFGMRKISIGKDEDGFNRLMLNNKPLFQYGPLDQGWWPDGLYTAPTDNALKYDLEVTKMLGFNMLRKHVKVEPARFYYHCDKLGLLVWQDMPNGNARDSLEVRSSDPEDAKRDPDSARQFERELEAVMDTLYNHPSIVTWVVFNEGWGQYDTARLAGWVKRRDPTRLCNAASGWADRGVGDLYDAHMYPGPGMEDVGPSRVSVLGEFGGLGLPVKDHLWLDKGSWGYRTFETPEQLMTKYHSLLDSLVGMIGRGLAAAVYTQTTDVESEVNGLMTYDRKVVKFEPGKVGRLHERLYQDVPKAQILLEDSEHSRQQWRYAIEQPDGEWTAVEYDDQAWQSGDAPFAGKADAYVALGTKWDSSDIWLRRASTFGHGATDLRLKVYYNVGEATVYINGKQVKSLSGRSRRHYQHIDISEHAGALRQGKNVIAVHCSAGKRGQAFDAGLYNVSLPNARE